MHKRLKVKNRISMIKDSIKIELPFIPFRGLNLEYIYNQIGI